jgi:hypothetical protein
MKVIAVDGWQGCSYYACEIVVKHGRDIVSGCYGMRFCRHVDGLRLGDILAVPKYAVREMSERRMEMDPPKQLFKPPHSPEMEH